MLPACFQHRYASVFLLDLLPLELDGARIEDDTYTTVYDECPVLDYGALGYDVVRVVDYHLLRSCLRIGLIDVLDAELKNETRRPATPITRRRRVGRPVSRLSRGGAARPLGGRQHEHRK